MITSALFQVLTFLILKQNCKFFYPFIFLSEGNNIAFEAEIQKLSFKILFCLNSVSLSYIYLIEAHFWLNLCVFLLVLYFRFLCIIYICCVIASWSCFPVVLEMSCQNLTIWLLYSAFQVSSKKGPWSCQRTSVNRAPVENQPTLSTTARLFRTWYKLINF